MKITPEIQIALNGKIPKTGSDLPILTFNSDRVVIWPHNEWDYAESNHEIFLENLEEVLIFEGLGGCAFKAFKHIDTSKPAGLLGISYNEAVLCSIKPIVVDHPTRNGD